VPLFGKGRRSGQPEKEAELPVVDEISSHQFTLKLAYSAKTSEVVQVKNNTGKGKAMPERLQEMLSGYVQGESELVEPLPPALSQSSPYIANVPGSIQWLQHNESRSPITRHALVVFETCDAVDMVFETLVVGMLDGHVDTSGYPDYNAIVGGVASHWDEMSGDLLVRAIVGWGGKGARGDTDRTASRLLAGLFNNIIADSQALGTVVVQRPVHFTGEGSSRCPHCGYSSGHDRAFYCPKCGMRQARG
jgi:hypothetical protein